MLIEQESKANLHHFIKLCEATKGVDAGFVAKMTPLTLRSLKEQRLTLHEKQSVLSLEKQWYHSFELGKADTSVYDTDCYLAELWSCWQVYSRLYLRNLVMRQSALYTELQSVESILDLGCGVGYSSAALTELFPQAKVYATNLENTKQYAIASKLAIGYGFTLLGDSYKLDRHYDLVFASEYFEHFPAPIEHLQHVLDRTQPHYMLIANSFFPRAVGHFLRYDVQGQAFAGNGMGRRFNAYLRASGYQQSAMKFWNNRPTCWKLEKRELAL